MRGKQYLLVCFAGTKGITPADAGKTARLDCPASYRGDHPRGCGENIPVHIRCSAVAGSPPRMRGKRFLFHFIFLSYGITPADAGKTHSSSIFDSASRDHPRGCGENCRKAYQRTAYRGSPPRMRGKLDAGMQLFMGLRITPADAGKTASGGI